MNTALLQHIELLIGSIGVILGIFFASLLLTTRRKQPPANTFLAIYLLAFSLRVGKSLFHNYFEIDATLRTFFLTTLLCVGPSIWLYTVYFINANTKQNLRDWIHYIPFLVLASGCWLIPNDGSWIFGWFYNFLTAHMFAYTLLSVLRLRRSANAKRFKQNPKALSWLYHFLGVNIILLFLYFLISELHISFYIGISFLFSSVIIYLSFWALKNPFLFEIIVEKYKQSNLSSKEMELLMERVDFLMKTEKPYIDPSLTLLKLSNKLEVSTKVLSQAINQIESLNYSQIILKHRVEEVKRLMEMSDYENLTIAAMAYDSGFSSISTFNIAFKKHAGQTAIAYRRALEQRKK